MVDLRKPASPSCNFAVLLSGRPQQPLRLCGRGLLECELSNSGPVFLTPMFLESPWRITKYCKTFCFHVMSILFLFLQHYINLQNQQIYCDYFQGDNQLILFSFLQIRLNLFFSLFSIFIRHKNNHHKSFPSVTIQSYCKLLTKFSVLYRVFTCDIYLGMGSLHTSDPVYLYLPSSHLSPLWQPPVCSL